MYLETRILTWKKREGTFFDLDTPWRSIDSNLTNCMLSLAICCLINSMWENRWRRLGIPRPFISGSLLDAISEEECSYKKKNEHCNTKKYSNGKLMQSVKIKLRKRYGSQNIFVNKLAFFFFLRIHTKSCIFWNSL